MKYLLLIGLTIVTVLGCSNAPTYSALSNEHGVTDSQHTSRAFGLDYAEEMVFTGTHTFYTYAAKTGEVLQDASLPAEAVLTYLGGHDVEFTMTEDLGGTFRTWIMSGELTPGGSIKLAFAVPSVEDVAEIVRNHVGCTISGDFGVYHGAIRDGALFAELKFNSKIPEYWPANDLFATPVDGPVHWRWIIDMAVDE